VFEAGVDIAKLLSLALAIDQDEGARLVLLLLETGFGQLGTDLLAEFVLAGIRTQLIYIDRT
jgi:hypothetical protein